MTDTERTAAVGARAAYMREPPGPPNPTTTTGAAISFAGIMMILLGGLPDHRGRWSPSCGPTYYLVGPEGLVVSVVVHDAGAGSTCCSASSSWPQVSA